MTENKLKTGPGCHWGNKFVFQWRNLRFFGAGSFRGLDAQDIDIFLDCGANIRQGRIIKINWPDGDVPDLSEADWMKFLEDMVQSGHSSGKDVLNILICCVGGHGRTGTALSILAALTGIAATDPVSFIREKYCLRAVETRSQCGYIKKIAKLSAEADLPLPEFDASCETF